MLEMPSYGGILYMLYESTGTVIRGKSSRQHFQKGHAMSIVRCRSLPLTTARRTWVIKKTTLQRGIPPEHDTASYFYNLLIAFSVNKKRDMERERSSRAGNYSKHGAIAHAPGPRCVS